MNKHIELVKKWLADPASVTQQELSDNSDSAYADAAAYSADPAFYYSAFAAADSAADATAYAYYNDNAYYIDNARKWIKRYEELTS
jgi:hypothetical protein